MKRNKKIFFLLVEKKNNFSSFHVQLDMSSIFDALDGTWKQPGAEFSLFTVCQWQHGLPLLFHIYTVFICGINYWRLT